MGGHPLRLPPTTARSSVEERFSPKEEVESSNLSGPVQ